MFFSSKVTLLGSRPCICLINFTKYDIHLSAFRISASSNTIVRKFESDANDNFQQILQLKLGGEVGAQGHLFSTGFLLKSGSKLKENTNKLL